MRALIRLILVVSICISYSAYAGVFMKQKHHTDSMQIMGQEQPAKDIIDEIWISESGFRSDNPEKSMIFNSKKNAMIILDHSRKVYVEMPLGKDSFSEIGGHENSEDAAAFQNMMQGMMKMNVSVQPTSEKKKIHDWPCQKYLMTIEMAMGKFQTEIWATEALKIDPALYQQFSSSMFSAMPGMQQASAEIQKEMQKIKGVQVMSISSNQIMGQTVRSTTELLEFKEGQEPANLLEIPAGYKKQSFQGM